MTQHRTALPASTVIRPVKEADLPALLRLINIVRLPGEPALTASSVRQLALAEHADVYAAVDADGAVVGAAALSVRPRDGSGSVHWIHAVDDDLDILKDLLSHAHRVLGPRRTYAFSEPANCSLARVPGLPISYRHRLADMLMDARYVPSMRQRYFLHDDLLYFPEPSSGPAEETRADVAPLDDRDGWRLRIRQGASTAATAAVLACQDGTALLWQFNVTLGHRRRGTGRRLLCACLDLAAANGARRVALYTDCNNTQMEAFLLANGFFQVDTLVTYERRS
ncbi:GNAT family N-acetyltransferase [Streptomyces sp. NPDC005529]|uniref:GNAT family N-acetyltransferase n=1 Tax=unclassified Streptomyces TaxID=2593676 RepID=UPI0033BAAAE2